MERSSPPFLYGHNFNGPADQAFNPKAVTQSSWIPAPPKAAPEGPLVNFDRHPDSYANIGKATWTPMSTHTKARVKNARSTQLGLRIVTLLGALGSLFCSIIITNLPTTELWIIRAGPIAAILHTIYAIYHLSRSPIRRPPASQAGYGLFASTLDAGIIPFYVFTAYMAHGEYTTNAYNWGTLFPNVPSFLSSINLTVIMAKATFICGVVNAGLHLISLSLSIFLAVMFRKISHLPPDMNPLEDNLTARPHKKRKQLEIDDKHLSQSTLNSALEDPLIDPPRAVPFTHTRGDAHRGSVDLMSEKRQSHGSFHAQRLSCMEVSSPAMLFCDPANQPYDLTSAIPAPEFRNVSTHSPEVVNPNMHSRQLTSRTADRSDTVSPLSDNWVTYSDRSPSPESAQNGGNTTLRQSSSVYSRQTNTTTASNGSGIRDWFGYGQRSGPSGSTIPEDTRGEYESLAMHEYYGNDDKREQDLGDRRINIFPDPEERDDDNDDARLPFNPLKLNPPTPQPAVDDEAENTDPVRRIALSDNPNLSHNPRAQVFVPPGSLSSPPAIHWFHDELEVDENPELMPDEADEEGHKKSSKLPKKRTKKSAYHSLKKDDSDSEDGPLTSKLPSSPATTEGDRKGRVISNSGADTARLGVGSGVGSTLSSYGSYIAGLGVGRRRDVSGKVAEEGRGGRGQGNHSPQNKGPAPIRAAGWARFAGL